MSGAVGQQTGQYPFQSTPISGQGLNPNFNPIGTDANPNSPYISPNPLTQPVSAVPVNNIMPNQFGNMLKGTPQVNTGLPTPNNPILGTAINGATNQGGYNPQPQILPAAPGSPAANYGQQPQRGPAPRNNVPATLQQGLGGLKTPFIPPGGRVY